jgi:hypothetical protein
MGAKAPSWHRWIRAKRKFPKLVEFELNTWQAYICSH